MRTNNDVPVGMKLLRWVGVLALTLCLFGGALLRPAQAATQSGSLTSGQWTYYDITLPTPQQGVRLVLSSSASSDFYLYTGTVHSAGSQVAASNSQTLHTLLVPAATLSAGGTYHVRIHANAALSYSYTPDLQYARPLTWDPGTSLAGSAPLGQPDSAGGDYLFQFSGQSPVHQAWRTTLQVSAGEADIYLQPGSAPVGGGQYSSAQAGSDALYLSGDPSGQTWFVRVHATPGATWNLVSGDLYVQDLAWDQGASATGTNLLSQPATSGGDYFFRITSQSSAFAAWRSVLKVGAGEADLYLQQSSPPLGATTYQSTQTGSDGIILGPNQFSSNQTWYLRVHAGAGASWSIFSGDIYAMDLGTLTDTSSNATATIGPEGMYYFKGSVDAATPAWRLWLNGVSDQIYVSKGTAPIKTGWLEAAEQAEAGQMLLVPPYLTSALYLVGVKGTPGSSFTLDSRKQTILTPSAVSGYSQGGGAVNFDFTLANQGSNVGGNGGFGYLTYKIEVPVQQIAWQLNLSSGAGQNADVYLRKGDVPNRWTNDALSEAPANVVDSITQVPPTLTDGAWYVTVYGTGTYTFSLTSKNPVITGISYINDNLTPLKTGGAYSTQNYQTLCPALESNSAVSCKGTAIGNAAGDQNRSGWQFYQVSDISSQLGFLGWQVDLSGQVGGSEIALRRNAVPARWRYRAGGSSYSPGTLEASQVDASSTLGFLQHPGHPADIWYVGVNTQDQALGAFQLTTREIPTPSFTLNDASTQCQGDATLCSNRANVAGQPAQTWKWFKVTIPADAGLLGWDLRLQASGGNPQMVVRRDQLPADFSTTQLYNGSYYYLYGANSWGSGSQWTAGGDWSGRYYTNSSLGVFDPSKYLVMGLGSPLEPGTYYVGVSRGIYDSGTTPLSYTLVSRGIGIGSDPQGAAWPLQVHDLAFSGTGNSASGSGLAAREAAYYRVTVPAGAKSWSVNLVPTAGEALLALRQGALPNVMATAGAGSDYPYQGYFAGTKRQKEGKELFYKYADSSGTTISAGAYYLAVVSEGQNPLSVNDIGTGAISYTVTSVGEMPVSDKTAAPLSVETPVTWAGESLSYGQQKVYRFRVPAGLASMEVRLKNRVGNPTMALRRDAAGSGKIPYLYSRYQPSEGGDTQLGSDPTLITVAQPAEGDYTLNLVADEVSYNSNPDASCDIEVTAKGLLTLPFTNGSLAVSGQDPQTWQYFTVTVPADAGLLGWDLRLQVTGGTPQMVVRRDQLPADFSTTQLYNGSYYYLYGANSWGSGSQWTAGGDWTGRYYTNSSLGVTDPSKYLVMGLGSPLEPGTYYVGVSRGIYDTSTTPFSYTLVSRGIGIGSDSKGAAWPLQVHDLAFSGSGSSASGTGLAPREAAYYRVTLPAGTKSWSVNMVPTAGEALLALRQGALPNVMATSGAGSDYPYQGYFAGTKRQKNGKELFYKYADPSGTTISAGAYYLAVVSEGQNLLSGNDIGTGAVSYTVTSVGEMPVSDKTAAPLAVETPVTWAGESLSYGQQKAYRFRVPAGLTSMEVRLKNRVGNPTMALRRDAAGSGKMPYLYSRYQPSEGGDTPLDSDATLITVAQPAAGDYTLNLVADEVSYNNNPDASCDIEVTAKGLSTLPFTNGSLAVSGQDPQTWQYFTVTVPADAGLLGWDLRLQVTGGTPQMVVRRDQLPADFNTTQLYNGSYYYLYGANSWGSGSQWAAGGDWTGRYYANSATGALDPNKYLTMGLGSPLEPGTYYIGVSRGLYDTSTTPFSYTLVSRGIGIGSDSKGAAWPLQVHDLAFSGTGNSASGTGLAPREAAYYRVTLPAGTKSWSVNMIPTAGEALLALRQGALPNVMAAAGAGSDYPYPGYFAGTKRQKDGKELFYKYADQSGTAISAGAYYLAVISEGQSPASAVDIGAGAVSYTVTSVGEMPVSDKTGAPLAVDTPVTWGGESLSYGQQKAYRFRVPAGLTSMEVRLKNRVGNPKMALRRDAAGSGKMPYLYSRYQPSEGGDTPIGSDPSLITVAQPAAGDYTLNLVADEVSYNNNPDSSCDIEVTAKAPLKMLLTGGSQLCSDPNDSTKLVTCGGHLVDQQVSYYQVEMPATLNGFPVAGWKINATTSAGSASLRIAKGMVPGGSVTSLTTTSPVTIVAPPYLSPGTWFIEVKGTGNTDYTVVSDVITAEPAHSQRSWNLPDRDNRAPDGTVFHYPAGLAAPNVGDSGINDLGAPILNPNTGDQGTDLAQNDWHFYRVVVPDNNAGLLKTTVEALSGRPELYLRRGSVPSIFHRDSTDPNYTSAPFAFDRSEVLTGTMYGNWVPLDRRTEVQFAPGEWWFGIRAVDSNVRYRLKVAAGGVRDASGPVDAAGFFQDLDLAGGSKTGQTLAAGDMRYYRVTVPQSSTTLAASTPLTWTINLQKQVGNVTVLVRDTIPPGLGTSAPYYQDWYADNSYLNANSYLSVSAVGDTSFTVPPVQPGKTYYLGVHALSDASFDLSSKAGSARLALAGIIPFVNGTVTANLAAGEARLYRIDAPASAVYWKQFAQHDAGISLYLAQDTVPPEDSYAHWKSSQANSSFSSTMECYPWQPGHAHYLLVRNTTGGALPFSFIMNGSSTGNDGAALVPGSIITYAGGGVGNLASGDSVSLNQPQGVALDGAGNIFFADTGNNLVRKLSATTGIISTVAGNATGIFGGDGGTAAAAPVNGPQGVAVDAAGNLYIADTRNQRIRKVSAATGVISTVAGSGTTGFSGDGGSATAAALNNPSAVALDGAGNLYISDSNNNRIRMVNQGGVISTIAGVGSGQIGDGGLASLASLNNPQGITLDGAGNLYIADLYHYRIRKVAAATGIITTVAGDGAGGYGGDGGPATAAQLSPGALVLDGSGNLYLSDRANGRIRKVAAATGVISTLAGSDGGNLGDGGPAGAARINPYALARDAGGNLYLADCNSNRIRKIAAGSGIISTVAGNGSTVYAGDGGAATAATLYAPQGSALDGAGNLYFADVNNHRVRKVSAATGAISTVAGNGTQGFSGDQGSATQASLSAPQGVAVDGAGNLFIADTNNCRIRKVDAAGMISTVASSGCGYDGDGALATAAHLYYPHGIALGSGGKLYIADTSNNRVRQVDGSGIITTVAGTGGAGSGGDGDLATAGQLNNPLSVALDGSGNLYVADYYNHRVRKVSAATGLLSTVAGTGTPGVSGDGAAATLATLNYPAGVAVDGGGNLFIADSVNSRVRRVDAANGVISTLAGDWNQGFSGDGGAATAASLNTPLSLVLDASGNLFVSDTLNNRIREVFASVVPITTATPPGGSYGAPVSVTLSGNKPVTTYFTTNGAAPTLASSVYSGPIALSASTTIRFFSVDGGGNSGALQSAAYLITMAAPKTTATPAAGVYSAALSVTLSCNDGSGPGCGATYYCLGSGCTPATVYSGPIAVNGSALIRFFSKDSANNPEAVSQAGYTIFPGYNTAGVLPGAPGTILTFAGGGSGNNSAGTAASLGNPQAVALDAAGNAYVADSGNNLVRRISAATGIITTVAGNGSAGFSGDGAAATSASLNYPQGVALDGAGNLYIADLNNHRIRKVNSSGVITTVAGNGDSVYPGDGSLAVAAPVMTPGALAADHSGNLFLVDGVLVRKVDTAGVITTVAGNGNGNYSGDGGPATAAGIYPDGLALDGAGNLYISNYNQQVIRKVSAATGIITTVAGNGSAGYGGDGAQAGSALLNNPSGIAVDGAGNLYIADKYNARIRKVTAATGVISTLAGNGLGYSGDGGPAAEAGLNPSALAADAAGNLVVIDNTNRIRSISAATGIIATIAGNAGSNYAGDGGSATGATLYSPQGAALDGSGNLYFADTNNHRIRKVNAATGAISTVAGNDIQGFSGDLGTATQASLNYPQGVALDGAGNLFIADTNNCRIRKVDSSGMISTVVSAGCSSGGDGGPALAGYLYYPQGIALDGSGNLYIADTGNHRIRKVDGAGVISTIAGNGSAGFSGDGAPATAGQLNRPAGVSLDGAGNLYIADSLNQRVRKLSAATGFLSTVAGSGNAGFFGDGGAATGANIMNPGGVAADGAGNLYLADSGNNRVRRVDAATGVIFTVAGSWTPGFSGDGGPATLARLSAPQGLALDAVGNLYIADAGNNRIREVLASVIPVTRATPPGGSYGLPQSVTLYASKPATTYYTTSGATPTLASSVYSGPLQLSASATVKFFSVDGAGNTEALQSAAYSITMTAPQTTASPGGGIFSVPQQVTLACNDGQGPGCASTYYCLGTGCTPATLYSAPIAITGSTLVRFYSKDSLGRSEAVAQALYTIFSGYGGGGALPGGLGVITTYAGGGAGNNSPGISANLNLPQAVALDGAGNVYLADSGHHQVRKISAATGLITTVAGSGSAGFSGDGGPAGSASLNTPQGVALDASGNLYIADAKNHRIRKVDTSGAISTVAGNGDSYYPGDGGPALAASINPAAVTVDSSGNLYLVDDSFIRKVDSAGVITTVAGGGAWGQTGDGGPATSAWMYNPRGVAVDGTGNLYIADSYSHRIRKVDQATGIISTIAGNGSPGFGGDGGPASGAQFTSPSGVMVDGAGNLLIADWYNYRVRKITMSTGVISTVVGNGSGGFTGDGGPASVAGLYPYAVTADGSGNIYIADYSNNRIRKVLAATGVISTIAGNSGGAYAGDGGYAAAAAISFPQGAATDSSGNLYFADSNNHSIRKVNAATGVISTVAGNGSPGNSGDLGPATQASLNTPHGVAVDGSGNVFIADTNNCRIRKVDTAGQISTVASAGCGFGGDGGPASAAYLYYPQGVALDGSGNLYIADTYSNRIRKVDSAGVISTVAGNGSAGFSGDGAPATAGMLNYPAWIAADAGGNLYITDSGSNRIRKVSSATGIISTVAGSGNAGFFGDGGPAGAANLKNPAGVALDGGGNLLIVDSGNNRLRRVDAATGIIMTVAGNWNQGFSGDGGPALQGSVNAPLGVALDGNGNIFLADSGNNRIRMIGESILYSVTLTPGAHGSITGPTRVNYGSMPSYAINPDTGYHVSAATVNGVALGAVPGYSYTSWITSNQTLTASFAINSYTLSFAAGANGGISPSASQTVNHGASAATVTAAPNAGYHLVNWTDGGGAVLGTTAALSLTNVTGPMAIRANFAINSYTISTSAAAGGAISASQTVNQGVNAAPVTVTPNTGYHIATVLVDNVSQPINNQKSFSVSFSAVAANHSVSASFATDSGPRLALTLAGTNGGAGTVNSNPSGIACSSGSCSAYFGSGTTVTLMASAGADSLFSGWSGACSATTGNCVLSLTADKAVTATFTYVPPARSGVTPPVYYNQLQAAYNAALSGGTIQAREFLFTENLVLNRAVNVYLDGGHDISYLATPGVTTLHGTLFIRSGSLRADKLVVH